jgi:hypothetical protein
MNLWADSVLERLSRVWQIIESTCNLLAEWLPLFGSSREARKALKNRADEVGIWADRGGGEF